MAIERTFSIIKPDATERNLTGAVNALIEKAGLRIVAQKRIRMTRGQAETFYAVHKARPFFGELVEFMTSVTHNVVPDPGNDPGLSVGFHTTGCLMFTEPGTFAFHCEIHLFKGSVVVQ